MAVKDTKRIARKRVKKARNTSKRLLDSSQMEALQKILTTQSQLIAQSLSEITQVNAVMQQQAIVAFSSVFTDINSNLSELLKLASEWQKPVDQRPTMQDLEFSEKEIQLIFKDESPAFQSD